MHCYSNSFFFIYKNMKSLVFISCYDDKFSFCSECLFLYASTAQFVGRGGMMFSVCTSVCACVRPDKGIPDRLAVDI